jgi:hypothetical protein
VINCDPPSHFIGGIVTNFLGKILESFITKFKRLGEQAASCIITLPVMAAQTSNQNLSLLELKLLI